MLTPASHLKIYVHAGPTDMRKSFDGLSGPVRSVFRADPLSGSLFLFLNRRRDRVKILYWDRDGLALWYKRLEQGTLDQKSERIHEVFTQARKEKRPSVSGRMWAYRSLLVPLNVFDFTVSRHRDGPDAFLVDSGFTGTLIADCYSGYQGLSLRSDSRIVRAACAAHARRKVFDARDNHPLLSSLFLAQFQELYDVEDRAKTMTALDRLALRQSDALPVWQRMRELLDGEVVSRLLPRDKFAEALGYLRNQWDALQVYLDDGRLPIDNNDVEQLMKQVPIGRKNWLFIGSINAGERAADLLTLVSSAVRNDLDVWAYVKDVLDQLLSGSKDYQSLRPDLWGRAHPEFIRTYRQEERRNRADANRGARDHRRNAR